MTMFSTRSIVTQNRKCEGCAHYDGNAAMKGGACDVGQQPFGCGDGREPRFGFASLTEMRPDQLDDLASPCVHGSPGSMNEQGSIEQPIQMQTISLGDELANAAHAIHGEMTSIHKGFAATEQGQTSRFAPAGHYAPHVRGEEPTIVDIAKSVYDQHMSPRQQFKFSLKEVLTFLSEKGFTVTDDDYAAVEG